MADTQPDETGSETRETIQLPNLGVVVIKRRYSISYTGWFWSVDAPNPWPATLPDGTTSRIDGRLYNSEYDRRHGSMERHIRRTLRRWAKQYERAVKEMAK